MISLFFLISLFWFNFQRLSAISKLHLCFLSHISNFIFDQSAFLTCLSKSLDEFLILTVSGFTSFNEYFYHFHFYNFSFYHIYIYIYIQFFLLEPHLQHMEVPRLEVKLELQLPAYTTATATPNPRSIYNLCHSSQQCQILNSLSEARD